MNWHGKFKSTFFSIWTSVGFPPPYDYEEVYSNKLKHYHFIGERYDITNSSLSPLNPQLLNRVYGFGVFIGEVIGCLLGLSDHKAKQRADWCGRFNLGISLFDYICDESNGLDAISAIPAFRLFLNNFSTDSSGLGQTEKILNNLTINILDELNQEENTNISCWKIELIRVMREMFDAECMLSTQHLNETCNPALIRKALCLKSVEPFRIMAEWMSHGGFGSERPTVNSARELGRALGYCYWLIDDAKDVWLDLESNRWNLFLVNAAEEEPVLFMRSRDAILDFRLTKMWEHSNIVHRLSMSVVHRLLKVTTQLRHTYGRRKEILGLVAASLARW